GETGFFFVVDGSEKNFGKLIIHPTMEGKSIFELKKNDGSEIIKMDELKDIYKKGTGKHTYTWLDRDNKVRDKIAMFTVYEPWKLSIAASMDKNEFTRDSSRIKWLLIISMWMMNILITIAVISAVYKQVTKPASSILDAVNKISSGDLTVSIDYKNKDEIGRLSDGIGNMLQSLKVIIRNILDASDKASQMVESLKNNASKTVQQVKIQTEQANTIALNSSEMSKTIGDIAGNAEIASNTASHSVDKASKGLSVAEKAVSTIEQVNKSTTELSDIVEGLQRSSNEISNIVTVIKDIADQTNLLALNAAIEAARAGEQGRGFAVVADEVRKLAEKTIHATTEISAKINSIQQEVLRTKTSMEGAASEVSSATSFINNVGNFLKEIVGSIEESKEQMTRIAAAVVEQSATTEAVAKNIDATVISSKEVENMAVNTMKESDNLLDVVKSLKETTSGFKL
ncbi:MAG TPA: HAMP domain-containing protein, partial [Nitrospirae bacterium]|nr:HAMP domain-containing protein [Nitrospirota bacterium]